MKASSQSGSAILWVLIGVALLAAVSVAVMRSSQTSTSVITNEEATAYANQIIAYGNQIQTAAKRMSLNGIEPTEFSFGNSVFKTNGGTLLNGPGENANCTTSACELFSTTGGQVTAQPLPFAKYYDSTLANAAASYVPGHCQFRYANGSDIGTSTADIYVTCAAIDLEVCKAINTQLGIAPANTAPPTLVVTMNKYTGQTPPALAVWASEALVNGKSAYCHTQSGANENKNFIYSFVILPL